MTTPVLATKLFVPPRRPNLVARPRLVALLDATLEASQRLTLVSAPAGFGKSTLLSDWLADLARREPPPRVGWVSLDAADNDVGRLLTHVVASLEGAGMPLDPSLVESLPTATEATLGALVNDVARAVEGVPATTWVLVLDDYHLLESAEAQHAMLFLLDHLPGRLHLVVATRADPPLPLARLRSRGQLVELRAADLRFTPSEADVLLQRSAGSVLSPQDVEVLDARTEGWATGLQLAALSLRGLSERHEIADFIEAFSGSNRFVIDYLVDEVLARQPVDVRDFLLVTAVLERFTGPLCDALTGRTDGSHVLSELERGNLFLVPLDQNRSWYRYHHLFADVLRARLYAEHPARVPELHLQASSWFAAHDLIDDAVRHALAGDDVDRAARLIEEALPEMRRTRQDGLLLAWVRALPDAVIRRNPVLSILAGWAAMVSGDLDALETRLDDAESALAAGARDSTLTARWSDTEDLRTAPATVSVYRASLAQARGDVDATVRHARRAVELAGPDDHLARGSGSGFLGLAAWAAGDVSEALTTFADAVRSLHAAGNLVDELDSTVVLADLWVAAGRPSRARRLCEQALASAADGRSHVRAAADLHVCLAELDREADDLAGAEAHLETAWTLRERTSITENKHRWFVAMAQVRSARGDHRGALDLLDEAAALYRPGFYPDVRPIAALRARVHLAAGDLEAATAWADERSVRVTDEAAYLREHEHLTLARLLLARHRAERADRGPRAATDDSLAVLLGLLDRMQAAATGRGRDGSVLEIRLLQALTLHARGDREAAVSLLARALEEAPEPDGQVRLYLDEGAPMRDVLRAVADTRAAPDVVRRRARRLLERARTGDVSPRLSLPDPLSPRELDVLRLLETDLTGPEIARELYVTLNTLRTHTKHIFTKLDVTTRAAAVRQARERGVLPG